MTPLGLGAAALAFWLGFTAPRFWWRGAAVLLILSLLFAVLIIAELHLTGDHLALTGPLVARSLIAMPIYMLVFYGIAAAIRAMARKLRR